MWSWPFVAFFVAFFLIWQWSIDLFHVPPYILNKPSVIVRNGWADIPRLIDDTAITGLESILGYFIAACIGVPIGLAIAFSTLLRRTVYPFFVSLEMVPKIAFAPLFISWLGFGLLPKVIIVVLVCFFPIALNAILAFGSLSEELTRFCQSTGADHFGPFSRLGFRPRSRSSSWVSNTRGSTQRSGRRSPSSSAATKGSASTSRS